MAQHQSPERLVLACGAPEWSEGTGRESGDAQAGFAASLDRAYADSGLRMLERLRGSFSLAICDTQSEQILISTDRMGTRPVYFASPARGSFVFASDCEVLSRLTGLRELDHQSLYDYIYFHMIPSPNTIYKGIAKLQPSEYARYVQGRVDTGIYWTPTFNEALQSGTLEESKQALKSTLQGAVKRATPSVNTGAFLSGGLDSTTVCGMLSRVQDTPAKVYSIGFDESGYDEIEYARTASRHFKLDHHEYYVTPDDVESSIKLIAREYDEPFGNSSAIPAYFCARLAKDDGIETLLAGDGGDELFAGNTRYAKQQVFDIYHQLPRPLRNYLLEPLFLNRLAGTLPNPIRKIHSYIQQARMPMPARMESYNFIERTGAGHIFAGSFVESIETQHPLALLTDTYQRLPEETSLLNKMLYLDWKITLADNDLRKVTRMCDLAGVEVRYPMLDDELVELSTQIPSKLKLKQRQLRYFYKYAMQGFLPDEIIHKSKHGFGLPFGEWLKKSTSLQELIYDSLNDLKTRNVIDSTFLDSLIDTHRSGHAAYYGTMVWVLAMLEMWLSEHAEDFRV